MISNVDEEIGRAVPPDTHLVIDDEVAGPFDAAGIRVLVAEGRVTGATYAWHPALEGWGALQTMPELAWLLDEAPLALPEPLAPPLPATLGRRLAAGAVDFFAWLILAVAIGAPLSAGINWLEGADRPVFNPRFDGLAQLIAALYFILPMSRVGGGRTPGYRLLGLRLVDREALRPPGLFRAFIWYVVSFARLVGWVTYFMDSEHRMLHDLASGTRVIVDHGRAA